MLGSWSSLVRDLRALPRTVWVLVGGQFINRFGSFVYPFLVLFLSERGLSLGAVATVLGWLAAGQLVAPFIGGYLADAIGRKNTLVLSLVGSATTLLGLYGFNAVWALALAALAHGMFAGMFNPAANALLSDVVTPELRVTAFALLRLAINAGFSAGPALAGLLFKLSPLYIFVGDAATTLLFALLALMCLPHGLRTITGPLASPRLIARSWWEAGRDAWENRPFVQLYFGMLLMTLGFTQVFNVLALHASARGLDTFAYGLAMGFNGLLILCFELPLARWLRRYAARPTLLTGFVLTGLGCMSFAWASTLGEFFLAMALFTVGEMISLPIAANYASELAPRALRGRYFGLFATVWGVGALVGSAGPWLYGELGAQWWVVIGFVGVLGGACMARPARDRRGVTLLTDVEQPQSAQP